MEAPDPAIFKAVSFQRAGVELTRGALTELTMFVLIVTVALWLFYGLTGIGMDSTDASTWRRSGMTLYIDSATGVEYLGAGGALTPRLNRDGSVMGVQPAIARATQPEESAR